MLPPLLTIFVLASVARTIPIEANAPSHQLQNKATSDGQSDTIASAAGNSRAVSPRTLAASITLSDNAKARLRPPVMHLDQLASASSIRRQKAEKLGLHRESPLPLYSHTLAPKEIESHPLTTAWNIHRQAMENGILEHNQLPPHFMPLRGEFRLASKKRKQIGDVEEEETSSKIKQQRVGWKQTKVAKTSLLQLDRKSAIPHFAQRLKNDDIIDHPLYNDWHRHRSMVEKGTIKPESLPPSFASAGKLIFKVKRKSGPPVQNAHLSPTEKIQLQQRAHADKMTQLKLRQDSATPIFALPLSAIEVKAHPEISGWHHYRSLVEQGGIRQDDLPDQFKAHKGTLRFRKNKVARSAKERRHARKSFASQKSLNGGESGKDLSSTKKGSKRIHPISEMDSDDWSFLQDL